jgi:enoyl-CoA hydratase/carnithine racemase
MSDQPHAIVERHGHVLTITLNRPEARNALSTEMMEIMSATWDEVNSNADIRVAIITGAGGAFCAGADLKAMTRMHPGDSFRQGNAGGVAAGVIKPLLKGFRLTKPLIAAVEGAAIAGGTEILQGTDIRVAGESARFGVSEARWSLYPMGGSAVRLRRQIPYTHAAEILLTGKHITAEEALQIGLVGHVVPDGQTLAKAKEIAGVICENGPLAVEAILRTLHETDGMTETEALKHEYEYGWTVFQSEDAKEGPRAFKEKRKPAFKRR